MSWGTFGSIGRAVFNPIGAIGGLVGGKTGSVLNAVGNPAGAAYDAMPGGVKNVVSDGWDGITDPGGHLDKRINDWSGADDTGRALAQQNKLIDQGRGAIDSAYNQAQGMFSPFTQGASQNMQDMNGMVRNGAFNPAYQQFQGQTSGGSFNPQFQGYQGPASGGNFNPQFQGYQGRMTAGNMNPAYQGYQGQMTSGQGNPQQQQFQGQTDFQAGARPERAAGTSENVNMFMDPGYKFRLEQGLGAIQGSAAAKGLLGSSGTLKGIGDYAQNAASQEFGNAYGRMMQNQANQQGDFENDRGFGQTNFMQNRNFAYGMNQDQNNWNASNADRSQRNFEGDRAAGMQNASLRNTFNQANSDRNLSAFNQDRAAGMQQNGMQNNFNQANADRGLTAFNQDRAAGMQQAGMQNDFSQQNASRNLSAFSQDRAFDYGMNQDQNNWNQANAMNNYNMWDGMVGRGYDAAKTGAGLTTNYGQSIADLYTGQGNAAAAAGMTQGNQRSGLIGSGFGLLGGLLGGRSRGKT